MKVKRKFKNYERMSRGEFGHSNYRVGSKEVFLAACYSEITYASNDRYDEWVREAGDKPPVCLIMHPDQVNHRYISYLLNESVWKDVYITKDLAEGFEHGFTIDFHQPYRVRNSALQAFRVPTEFETVRLIGELWECDPDLSFQQILLMAGNFGPLETGGYRWYNHNDNHTPYNPSKISLSNYLNGEFSRSEGRSKIYYMWGYENMVNLTREWGDFSCNITPTLAKHTTVFGDTQIIKSFNADTICEFANFLKGKYT